METNKDLILRSIKYFSEFLMALTKQKPLEIEDVDICINEFLLKNFNISLKSILEKQTVDIIKVMGGDNNYENIKDFADVLFIKHSMESDSLKKMQLSEKIIELYQIYQSQSNTYSFEIQLRMNKLKTSTGF